MVEDAIPSFMQEGYITVRLIRYNLDVRHAVEVQYSRLSIHTEQRRSYVFTHAIFTHIIHRLNKSMNVTNIQECCTVLYFQYVTYMLRCPVA